VPAVAGFVCDKAAVLGDEIKGTFCNIVRIFDGNEVFNLALLMAT
jgi:hypothetical protein